MEKQTRNMRTQTYQDGLVDARMDSLVAEEPLEIRLAFGSGQGRKRFSVAVTMRTPGDDEALALGFLFTEGIIGRADAVIGTRWMDENTLLVELQPTVFVDEERLVRHFFTSSSCGLCGKATLDSVRTVAHYFPISNKPVFKPDFLYALPDKMRAVQETFESTGGLHATALFDVQGTLLYLKEDIGRHNAVDKVIGTALQDGLELPFKDHVLMVSGRAGFELVQKASMAGIPLMAAVGAPSALAVDLAEASDMTLVGFLRGRRFNVYTAMTRIKG
jgi:FdhD protein